MLRSQNPAALSKKEVKLESRSGQRDNHKMHFCLQTKFRPGKFRDNMHGVKAVRREFNKQNPNID